PDVRVARGLPRIGAPRFVAGLALAGHGIEAPDLLARDRVERTHIAGRIALVREPIADAISKNHKVAIHDGRRRVGVVLAIHLASQALGEIDDALLTEGGDGLASLRVERDQ